jgi:hypothetical protein
LQRQANAGQDNRKVFSLWWSDDAVAEYEDYTTEKAPVIFKVLFLGERFDEASSLIKKFLHSQN